MEFLFLFLLKRGSGKGFPIDDMTAAAAYACLEGGRARKCILACRLEGGGGGVGGVSPRWVSSAISCGSDQNLTLSWAGTLQRAWHSSSMG